MRESNGARTIGMKFFTNGFSPFARKVALALDYKGLAYEAIDGLTHANREALLEINPAPRSRP